MTTCHTDRPADPSVNTGNVTQLEIVPTYYIISANGTAAFYATIHCPRHLTMGPVVQLADIPPQ